MEDITKFKDIINQKDFFKSQLLDQFNIPKEDGKSIQISELKERSGTEMSMHIQAWELLETIEELIKQKPSRELSIIKTKIEEAIMWAEKL